MTKRRILEILFWIALIVAVILILWKIFGNSPSDFSIIVTFGLMILFKIWAISDEMKEFKHEVRVSFSKVKDDFNDLRSKLKIKDKI